MVYSNFSCESFAAACNESLLVYVLIITSNCLVPYKGRCSPGFFVCEAGCVCCTLRPKQPAGLRGCRDADNSLWDCQHQTTPLRIDTTFTGTPTYQFDTVSVDTMVYRAGCTSLITALLDVSPVLPSSAVLLSSL